MERPKEVPAMLKRMPFVVETTYKGNRARKATGPVAANL